MERDNSAERRAKQLDDWYTELTFNKWLERPIGDERHQYKTRYGETYGECAWWAIAATLSLIHQVGRTGEDIMVSFQAFTWEALYDNENLAWLVSEAYDYLPPELHERVGDKETVLAMLNE